jgi:hypothetical protein
MVVDELKGTHADRSRGALLRGALGDSLGRPFEGRPDDLDQVDVWARSAAALRWTDDTAMTLALAEHLLDGPRDALVLDDLVERFTRTWQRRPSPRSSRSGRTVRGDPDGGALGGTPTSSPPWLAIAGGWHGATALPPSWLASLGGRRPSRTAGHRCRAGRTCSPASGAPGLTARRVSVRTNRRVVFRTTGSCPKSTPPRLLRRPSAWPAPGCGDVAVRTSSQPPVEQPDVQPSQEVARHLAHGPRPVDGEQPGRASVEAGQRTELHPVSGRMGGADATMGAGRPTPHQAVGELAPGHVQPHRDLDVQRLPPCCLREQRRLRHRAREAGQDPTACVCGELQPRHQQVDHCLVRDRGPHDTASPDHRANCTSGPRRRQRRTYEVRHVEALRQHSGLRPRPGPGRSEHEDPHGVTTQPLRHRAAHDPPSRRSCALAAIRTPRRGRGVVQVPRECISGPNRLSLP